ALAARLAGHDAAELQPGRLYDDLQRALYVRGALGAEADAALLLKDSLHLDRSQPVRHTQRGPDGRMMEVASDPTPDGGFVITHVDITPLAYAEEEAQRRAELLQSMLENMRHGVLLFGPDRRLIAANSLASRLTGLPPGTYRIGRTLDEMMAEAAQTGQFDPAHAARVVAADRSAPQSYRRVRPDGIVLEITSDPTPDGGFVVVLTDVTKLAAAEADAERRSRLMQAMLDNIRHGVCLFDAEGRIVACNALAATLSGLTLEDMRPGVSIHDMRRIQAERGEYGPPELAERRLRDREAGSWTLPERFVRRRGNGMMLEVRTDATPDCGFIRTYTDVTEDHRVQAELEAATEAAEAANRAKSRFLATMSHELRTPLNAIVGFSESLLRGPADAAERTDYARIILEAGQHLRALIDDILDVARAETGRFGVTLAIVAPGAVAAKAGRMMQGAMAAAEVTLTLDIGPALPEIRADAQRLRQILLNLLSNAAKFTPAGGSVTLAVRAEADGRVAFRVAYSGIGLPESQVTRAFEPFTQLDGGSARRYPGSGIGLHLSRVLAEAQGGTLDLTSVPGEGTTATLRLPVAEPEPTSPETRTAGADA
ncbi:MAG TPA: PAS-domain containing protein, partial [Acetobacteraceae bacterium]|nr:PAS-domain containing protein [Acetobacteraceae bacterium]